MMEQDWDSIHSGEAAFVYNRRKIGRPWDSGTRWFSTEKSYKEFLKEHGVAMPEAGNSAQRYRNGDRRARGEQLFNAGTGRYEPGEQYYFDSYFTEMALEGLRRRWDTTKPLLLNVVFLAPHPPLQIPDPWYRRWARGSLRFRIISA